MNAHRDLDAPSEWVRRWAPLIPRGGRVLDVAAGRGRHARYLATLGHPIEAVDRDAEAMRALAGLPGISARCADLESGDWPYHGQQFAAVVVTNYLHRPLFEPLLAAVAPGGTLIYETFAAGNENYGRPVNPDFLLNPGELLDIVHRRLTIVAYDDLAVSEPRPARVQRLCAVKPAS